MRLPLIVEVQCWKLCVGIGGLEVVCCGWQVSGAVCGNRHGEQWAMPLKSNVASKSIVTTSILRLDHVNTFHI